MKNCIDMPIFRTAICAKRRKYAFDAQSKIAFTILLALLQQKTLQNGG